MRPAAGRGGPRVGRLLAGLAVYGLVVAAMALAWERPTLLLAVMLGLSAGALAAFRARRLVAFYLVGALLGPLAESFAIVSGAWSYAATDLVFPLWLPPAWGLACLLLVVIVESALPDRAADDTSPRSRP